MVFQLFSNKTFLHCVPRTDVCAPQLFVVSDIVFDLRGHLHSLSFYRVLPL